MRLRKFLYRAFLSMSTTSTVNLTVILLTLVRGLSPQIRDINRTIEQLAISQGTSQPTRATQLEQLRKKNIVKIKVLGDKAYWVHNNIFYEGSVVNGYIDREAAKPIDAYKLSPKEFGELLDILDNIT